MKSFLAIAALMSGVALAGCTDQSGPAMSGTNPGSAAAPLQSSSAAATAAQPGTSTGVTAIGAGNSQGRSSNPVAVRNPAAARGNLEAPPEFRPYDPRIGGSGSRS